MNQIASNLIQMGVVAIVEKINFAWPVTSEHAVIYQHFLNKIKSIKNILQGKRIVIFGAGIRGCNLLKILEDNGFENIVFCDNNLEKQGNLINQYDIISLEQALEFSGEIEQAIEQAQVILISPEDSTGMSRQLTAVGLKEGIDWFSFALSTYDSYVKEYTRPVNEHMLAVGDCAFTHIALSDSETDSLGDMLKYRYGENKCKVLAMHGIGQQAQSHIIRSLIESGEKPLLVLLLTVLEVLTSKAHIMPRTQHPNLIKKLTEAAKLPNSDFIGYAELAKERFERFQVESFASSENNRDEASEKLFMKMNYLFKIREETEGVIYLKKTIKMLNEENIEAVLYIPPVNYMQGEKFFGEEFITKYKENFTKLFSFLDKEGLIYNVADASFLLPESEFAACNTIDETTNFTGRSKLLKFLSENEQIKYLFG